MISQRLPAGYVHVLRHARPPWRPELPASDSSACVRTCVCVCVHRNFVVVVAVVAVVCGFVRAWVFVLLIVGCLKVVGRSSLSIRVSVRRHARLPWRPELRACESDVCACVGVWLFEVSVVCGSKQSDYGRANQMRVHCEVISSLVWVCVMLGCGLLEGCWLLLVKR